MPPSPHPRRCLLPFLFAQGQLQVNGFRPRRKMIIITLLPPEKNLYSTSTNIVFLLGLFDEKIFLAQREKRRKFIRAKLICTDQWYLTYLSLSARSCVFAVEIRSDHGNRTSLTWVSGFKTKRTSVIADVQCRRNELEWIALWFKQWLYVSYSCRSRFLPPRCTVIDGRLRPVEGSLFSYDWWQLSDLKR